MTSPYLGPGEVLVSPAPGDLRVRLEDGLRRTIDWYRDELDRA